MKKLLTVVLAAAMAASLAACGSSTSSTTAAETTAAAAAETTAAAAETEAKEEETTAAASSKTELNVATELMASTFEPATDWDSWYVQRYGVAECLVKNGDDGTFQPWLADSWSVADDNLTWTFNIKKGVKFSNGTDMTPSKVVESIERLYKLTDPDQGGNGLPQGYMTYSSITADDEAGTVTIVTENPVPDMPGVMAYPWMFILDAEATADIDTNTASPICTGPYYVTEFNDQINIELEKNPYYYAEVPFEKVHIIKIGESASRAMALQDGSADMAINIAPADREMLASSGYNVDLAAGSRVCITFMNFNNEALADKAVREAVNMAIDGETIASVTTNNAYIYGYAAIPSSYDFGYDELTNPDPYDPEKAKAILDEAGVVDSDGDGYREYNGQPIDFNYVVQANRSMDLIGQAVAANLDEIGIKATIQVVEHLNDYLSNGSFDLINASYMTMPTGDPGSFFSHWVTDSSDNNCGYSNPEYDEIFEKLKSEFDTAKRKEYIIQLQQILLDDAVIHQNGYFTTNICSANTISGVVNNPSDFYWVNNNIVPAE